jgi:3-deoxy-manno-octulosonate cytidylyltransferase (CMP-KDO synthetase)
MYSGWDELVVATCDEEIRQACLERGYSVIMTGDHHTRALDRVAEAATKIDGGVKDDDIVVCVQGDEPMLEPEMIEAVIEPIATSSHVSATVLAMEIHDEEIWRNPNIVKLIANDQNEVLYTSRSPIPWAKEGFSPALGALRIHGIFAFRWKELQEFTAFPETRLERLESCDSNRILDMPYSQYVAKYPNRHSFSVDSPEDVVLVEQYMPNDPLWGRY